MENVARFRVVRFRVVRLGVSLADVYGIRQTETVWELDNRWDTP